MWWHSVFGKSLPVAKGSRWKGNRGLIKVSPNNIEESSRQYGKDLRPFENLMSELYDNSILNKYNCTYNTEEELINKIENLW